MLQRAGHQCWTAAEAGLTDAADDDLSVYADDRGAALVTHDREWEAATVMRAHLDDLVAVLRGRATVVVSISPHRLRVYERDWR